MTRTKPREFMKSKSVCGLPYLCPIACIVLMCVSCRATNDTGGGFLGIFKKKEPICTLSLSSDTVIIREGIESSVSFYIALTQREKKSFFGKWIVVVTRDKEARAIIKMFSGGSFPPSTIRWNLRDAKDNFLIEGTYYVRMIIVNSDNSTVKSDVKKLILL